jgi:hypothetical protein
MSVLYRCGGVNSYGYAVMVVPPLYFMWKKCKINQEFGYVRLKFFWGVTFLMSVDISTCSPWITQNEQHFVAGEIPHELDVQMEGH